jgi:uncharacterized protein (TIGR02594 family)
MPQFKTLVDTNLLKEAKSDATPIAPIRKGTLYSGEQKDLFVKTRIPEVSPEEGFVEVGDISKRLAIPEPLTPEDHVNFCAGVTFWSREVGSDRDYLIAVAFDSTKNLTVLGDEKTPKAGPFQFDAPTWQAAITGVAKSANLSDDDRLDWACQPTVAAFLAREATEKFEKKFQRLPTFRELYFLQLKGDGALNALETPATVEAELKALQERLEAAYVEALKVIDKLRPEDKFMRASVGDPPWMAVAREQKARGVKEDPGDLNTEEIAAYFKTINAHVGTVPGQTVHWCGAFVGYCIKTCGVAAAANKVAPEAVGADYWLTWDHAPDPPPVGAIVVFPGEHVGFLAEGSTATQLKILGGNQSDSVSIATRNRAGAQFRWFAGIPQASAPAVPAGQNAFVTLAPQIMKKLLGDFPEAELNEMHLAAILGNLGHECAGFTVFIEQHPIHVGLPGIGWAQWTFDRGDKFRARLGGKSPGDFDTNYEFLREELKVSHKRAISAMKTATDLLGAVKEFERIFEVAHPDFKRYKERMDYAQIALQAFKGA